MGSTRALACALSLLFSVIPTSWGAQTVAAEWNAGSIEVQGEQVIVRFANGEVAHLTNVRLIPDRNPYSETKVNLEMILPAAANASEASNGTAEERTVKLVRLRSNPKHGVPISGLKVARLTFSDGSTRLFFVLADRVLASQRGFDGAIFEVRATEASRGKWQLSDHHELKNELKMYPNDVGVAKISEGSFGLYVYDNRSGVVGSLNAQIEVDYSNKPRTSASGWAAYPLPGSFQPGQDFSRGGSLLVPQGATAHTFIVETVDGESVVYGEGTRNSKKKDTSSIETYADYKMSGRLLWIPGSESIDRYLKSQLTGASEVSVDLSERFQEWVKSGAQNQRAQFGRAAKQKATPLWFSISLSDALLNKHENVRFDVTAQIVKQIAAIQGNAEALTFYVRFPSWPDSTQTTSIAQLMAAQAAALMQNNVFPEIYVIVDSIDFTLFHSSQESVRRSAILSFQQYFGNMGAQNVRYVLLGKPDAAAFRDHYGESIPVELVSVDQLLPRPHRNRLIGDSLTAEGFRIGESTLEDILTRIEKDLGPKASALNDLNDVSSKLATVFSHMKLSPGDADFADTVAKLFVQITGERRVGPFTPAHLKKVREIPRRLSTSYPGHIEKAVTGRDWLLRDVESKLLSWMGYGYKTRPVKPLLFIGDHGTGKTTTAQGLIEVLGAASETLNMSALVKPKSGYFSGYDASDGLDLRVVQDAIERLVLDPNPIKILVLDEIHATPSVFNALLPAFGDGDRKAPGVINLDGIIVVMNMNISTENEIYKHLAAMDHSNPQFQQMVFELVKHSLAGKYGRIDEKVIGALAGRLMSDMIYYPALGMDHTQQVSLLEQTLARFEQENKVRLVLQEAAVQYLRQVAAAYTGGNFRSVERVLEEAITGAIGRFISENPDKKLRGYFVLGTVKGRDKKPVLKLLEVEGDAVGMEAVVRDTFSRYVSGVDNALTYAAEVYAESSDASHQSAASKRNFELMLDAFRLAANKAWELNVAQIETSVPMPDSINSTKQAEVRKFIASGARTAFESFADYGVGAQSLREKEALLKTAHNINRVFVGLARIYRLEQQSSGSKPFSAWVEAIREMYVKQSEAAGVKKTIAPGSIDAVAVAAGYLVDSLGRQTATVMFNDMNKRARDEAFDRSGGVKPSVDGAVVPTDISPECQRLLTESQLSSKELDKIVGD